MIRKITDLYIRAYSDTGQVLAYCEWIDDRGDKGRTEGEVPAKSQHMQALMFRAIDEGVEIRREKW